MDLFEHAAQYPNAAGYRDTDTSKAAASSINPDINLLRGKVLECLRHFKHLTADECAGFLDIDKLSIRPRFTELKEQGLVVDTGERRKNKSGRKAIVWRLTSRN
jgi:predicted HTH transcriptional regulator